MVCLASFMCAAGATATALQHPASPWFVGTTPGLAARLPMAAAMALTAIAIVYSPLGRRSGAHMNPAVTLTFLHLGKVRPRDAAAYIAAQFLGGILGIGVITRVLANRPAHPSVNYVATLPGAAGAAAAFAAETAISFGMMFAILSVSNHVRYSRLTGVCAGLLVFLYITFESPLSGMSMNPARSFGPALLARSLDTLWIYFSAPLAGMWLAARAFVACNGRGGVRCAKLDHAPGVPCIFCLHHEVRR